MKYKLLFIIFEVFSKHNIKDKEFVLPIEKNLKGLYIVKVNDVIHKKIILY